MEPKDYFYVIKQILAEVSGVRNEAFDALTAYYRENFKADIIHDRVSLHVAHYKPLTHVSADFYYITEGTGLPKWSVLATLIARDAGSNLEQLGFPHSFSDPEFIIVLIHHPQECLRTSHYFALTSSFI